ncbi:MAG: methionine--tRNA ligase [Deltaproteobacteria bacterium]|nr:methionine--tRNA ligase [Deltaproteobacteria bacterium]
MRDDRTFYITTPIYYVNGLPHIGHAYTTIAADVASRYMRLKGHRVRFLTGTDEHGQKVMEKATARGMSPKEHCDDMVVHWKAMWEKLDIRYDHFIRTTDPSHMSAVQSVLTRLWDEGLIYKAEYTGWYSVREEIFVTDKDVESGAWDKADLQQITESNYFFRMGSYQRQLIDAIEARPDFIQPSSRRNEVLGFLRKDLDDLCISRPKARMSWGIELPFDPDFVTYVWFDALLNYLTGVGYPDGDWETWWPASYHLVGKDILTTHSVYWSTMLMALGLPLAGTLYAHGWWKSADGEKMSKSLGNTIDVGLLADEFGVDATRFFFLREIGFGADGTFSYQGFMTRYNADLANDLGNMVHRGLSMTSNWLGGVVPPRTGAGPDEAALDALATQTLQAFDEAMGGLQFHKALEALWELVKAGNKYIDTQAPWALNKAGDTQRLTTVLRAVLEIAYLAATLLQPFMPSKAAELLEKLGRTEDQAVARCCEAVEAGAVTLNALPEGGAITVGEALFPRFREMPERVAALFATEEAVVKAPKVKEPKKKKTPKAPAPPAEISYEDFAKVALKVGEVKAAERHPSADRLLVLQVDIGEEKPRQIVAGIAAKFAPQALIGRRVVVVANLAPAQLRGVESQGMLLAAGGAEVIDLVGVDAPVGEPVR